MNDNYIAWDTLEAAIAHHKTQWQKARDNHDLDAERAQILAFTKSLDKWMVSVVRQFDPNAVEIARGANYHTMKIAMQE